MLWSVVTFNYFICCISISNISEGQIEHIDFGRILTRGYSHQNAEIFTVQMSSCSFQLAIVSVACSTQCIPYYLINHLVGSASTPIVSCYLYGKLNTNPEENYETDNRSSCEQGQESKTRKFKLYRREYEKETWEQIEFGLNCFVPLRQ